MGIRSLKNLLMNRLSRRQAILRRIRIASNSLLKHPTNNKLVVEKINKKARINKIEKRSQ
jgi:hypothetical protein|tara:strand:- start:1776 stop:1955 length:180 start_codon:yes stop_codon:yes gene_type:complete